MSNREDQILAKARIILAVKNNESDETIYSYSEPFGENRIPELVRIIKETSLDHKISFFSEFLVEKHPKEKRYLLINAIRLSNNWGNKVQTEDLIKEYKKEFEEDFDITIERLYYYLKYETKNIDMISSLYEKALELQKGGN